MKMFSVSLVKAVVSKFAALAILASLSCSLISQASAQELVTQGIESVPGQSTRVLVAVDIVLGKKQKNSIYPGSVRRYFWLEANATIDPDRELLTSLSVRFTRQYIGTQEISGDELISERGVMQTPIIISRNVDLGEEVKISLYYLGSKFFWRDRETESLFAQAVISALGSEMLLLNEKRSFFGVSIVDALVEGGVDLEKMFSLPFGLRLAAGIRQEMAFGAEASAGLAGELDTQVYGRLEIQPTEKLIFWAAATQSRLLLTGSAPANARSLRVGVSIPMK